ncbi:LacI family transcriptional regulator (plasmid) [Lactiplantibacillus plantarum subsp. plantarum]|uniref:LacI family DNA-binding transcriptional regulator n=1 Tax=Lactiplantibacillus plantarum TaxID=1590 RepID=UPI001980FF6A|nr:LacI family DNA-binding transcriptional regulator [Lactiplantibacillus plantarum]QSE56919.1 LacI family DNA-binding transcriptional regulator [Lactiplantibacillus plantarum]QXN30475.1 LacI family transcriptional regulator [Lactiplantibacillus plantarum subsp. plantarum]QXN33441.1 LacI family transcriptional regulator [Lactiplantibacillus plantarum subsp. plantarum]UJS15832.1 LacI family transcriptional regulator [Lactiplantibacillus plantarum subsp. plantarum]WRM32847.1 LacI family DNA-bind
MATSKISIKEIAELADVSVATVSRILNDNGGYSEATRQRVMAVVQERGYHVNSMAKGLRMNRTNTIGLIIPDLANSFFADLVEKLEKRFFAAGYATIICDTARDEAKEASYLKRLDARMVDGLIIISGASEFDTNALTRQLPIVCIDRKPKSSGVAYVGSDHEYGAKLATATLADVGTTPVLIGGGHESPSTTARIKGYQTEMAARNLQDQELILRLATDQDHDPDVQRAALRNLLRQLMSTSKLPLGVFAVSDKIAANLLVVARELYLNVPNELKIIGFDDAPIARYTVPELTTIHQDTSAIAERTANYLLEAITDRDHVELDDTPIPIQLIQRGTL